MGKLKYSGGELRINTVIGNLSAECAVDLFEYVDSNDKNTTLTLPMLL